MAICIKISGVSPDKIESYIDLNEAVKALYKTKNKKYAISNYTAIQATRHEIFKSDFQQGRSFLKIFNKDRPR